MAAITSVMAAIDGSAVIVAFPTIVDEFQASVAWVGWVITAFALSVGITLPLVGRVADLVGQRTAFVGALAIFLVGSVGAALSTSVEQLVAFRAVGGLGGGAVMPLSAGIVADRFVENRARMLGLMTSFFPIGGILGPNIGGLLVAVAGWRAIFLLNVPFCLLAMALGLWLLKGGRPAGSGRSVDLPGALLLGSGTLALMTGLTLATAGPTAWRDVQSYGLVLAGLALWGALAWWERRAEHPIIEIDILRLRPLFAANLIAFGISFFVFAMFGMIPLFLTRTLGVGPGQIGILITPRALLMVPTSMVVSFLLPRIGFRLPLVVGFLIVSLSTTLISRMPGEIALGGLTIPDTVVLALLLAIAGLGMGFVVPSSNSVGMDLLPTRVTAIAGMRGAFNVLGNVLGTTGSLMIISLAATQTDGLVLVFQIASVGMLSLLLLVPLLPGRTRPGRGAQAPIGRSSEPLVTD